MKKALNNGQSFFQLRIHLQLVGRPLYVVSIFLYPAPG